MFVVVVKLDTPLQSPQMRSLVGVWCTLTNCPGAQLVRTAQSRSVVGVGVADLYSYANTHSVRLVHMRSDVMVSAAASYCVVHVDASAHTRLVDAVGVALSYCVLDVQLSVGVHASALGVSLKPPSSRCVAGAVQLPHSRSLKSPNALNTNCPGVHVVMLSQARSVVAVSFALVYCVSHSVRLMHTRSVVGVADARMYCACRSHMLSAVHTRSVVDVAGVRMYCDCRSHTLSVVHTRSVVDV